MRIAALERFEGSETAPTRDGEQGVRLTVEPARLVAYKPSSLNPGCSSGLRPCGQRNFRYKNKLVLLAAVDEARFRRPVRPGDQMRIEMVVISRRSRACKMKGTATVDGVIVAEATAMCVLQDREQKPAEG